MQSAPQVHAPAHPSKPWSSWLLRRDVLLRIGLVLLICLYARTLRFDFVYDDLMIPVSPWVQSWHGILDAFKSDVFGAQGQAGTVYYRPIASALVVLVARLTAATPPWYHLSAILVDLALYIVSFFFGRAFFEDDVLALEAVRLQAPDVFLAAVRVRDDGGGRHTRAGQCLAGSGEQVRADTGRTASDRHLPHASVGVVPHQDAAAEAVVGQVRIHWPTRLTTAF